MHGKETVKIGSRKSALAKWQAKRVQSLLQMVGQQSDLVLLSSIGDQNLQQPLYQMGIQGIFTKVLDVALLNYQIDLAVHSLKDVPTQLPEGLILAAIPERADASDAIVLREGLHIDQFSEVTITVATSSLRRAAQWLERYPHHHIVNTRGNIETRIRRVQQDPSIDATIIAAVGPQRIGLEVQHLHPLPWMIPAPSQGALGVVCREADQRLLHNCQRIEHERSRATCTLERSFLQALQAGCSMPVAAHAHWQDGSLYFQAAIHSIDGKKSASIRQQVKGTDYVKTGQSLAAAILQDGGRDIMSSLTKIRS